MWFDTLFGRRLKSQVRGRRRRAGVERGAPCGRRMWLEPLEERRLLAPVDLLCTLDNPGTSAQDYSEFGTSVASDGNLVVAGAPYSYVDGEHCGGAYVYDATTGNSLVTLKDPTLTGSASFGSSVAVSGNTVVVGAPWCDRGASNAGAAYIFDATTGNLLHTLDNPTPASGDEFGHSVAVSGNTVVIGAWLDDTGATNAGSVYVYDATTGNLLRTINNPTPADYEDFGNSVAVWGSTLVVGAYQDSTGALYTGSAYIYDATTGTLLHTLNNPTPESGDRFGCSVAVSGNMVVVGAKWDDTGASGAGSAWRRWRGSMSLSEFARSRTAAKRSATW